MVFILIVGGGLGRIAYRARVQRDTVEAVRQAGGMSPTMNAVFGKASGRHGLRRARVVIPAAVSLVLVGCRLGVVSCGPGLVRFFYGVSTPVWGLAAVFGAAVLMTSVAFRRGRLRPLLGAPESLTWYGGLFVLAAGFLFYAPLTFGDFISHHRSFRGNLWSPLPLGLPTAPHGWPMVPTLRVPAVWPMAYGGLAAVAAFVTAVSGRRSAYRWRWGVTGLFLASIAVAQCVATCRGGPEFDREMRVFFLAPSGLVLAALAFTVGRVPGDRRKAHVVDLVAALWLFIALDPRRTHHGQLRPLALSVRGVGPGFWLQLVGTELVLLGALSVFVSGWAVRRGLVRRPRGS